MRLKNNSFLILMLCLASFTVAQTTIEHCKTYKEGSTDVCQECDAKLRLSLDATKCLPCSSNCLACSELQSGTMSCSQCSPNFSTLLWTMKEKGKTWYVWNVTRTVSSVRTKSDAASALRDSTAISLPQTVLAYSAEFATKTVRNVKMEWAVRNAFATFSLNMMFPPTITISNALNVTPTAMTETATIKWDA